MTVSTLNDALHQLMHAYRRQLKEGIRHHQIALPITHVRVLKGVCRIPECTAGKIAQRMDQDKARITRVLNDLQQAGMTEKANNPHDRRSHFLSPTPEGLAMLERITALEQETAQQLTRHLGDQDLDTFLRIVDTIIHNASGLSDTGLPEQSPARKADRQDTVAPQCAPRTDD